MTKFRLQLQKMLEVLTEIDILFQYPEEATEFASQALMSEENTQAFLKAFKNRDIDIDEQIEDLENDLNHWKMKFEADPALKQIYVKVGERLKTYIDKYDPPKYRSINERIKKAGVLKPLIEPLKLRRLSYIPENEIEDYRIEIESRFLAYQAQRDSVWDFEVKDLKAKLTEAVSNAKLIELEYDEFLANKLILEHLDNTNDEVDVYNIPYNKLASFNKKTEYYLK
ncbi:MAG: hypothetical protein AAGC64_04590 [Bacteroidota bacterium]